MSSKCSGCGGEDFGCERVVPIIGRSGRSIPAAGYDGHDNEAHSRKTRRPEDFWGKGHLASSRLAIQPFPQKPHPRSF